MAGEESYRPIGEQLEIQLEVSRQTISRGVRNRLVLTFLSPFGLNLHEFQLHAAHNEKLSIIETQHRQTLKTLEQQLFEAREVANKSSKELHSAKMELGFAQWGGRACRL